MTGLYSPHTAAEPTYGWHLVLDLHNCDPSLINNSEALRYWVTDLVKGIDMVPHGDPVIDYIRRPDPVTSGFTVVQLIETSSITAHLSPHLRTAHVDVFSCRVFDPAAVVRHTEKRFGGSGGHLAFLPRG